MYYKTLILALILVMSAPGQDSLYTQVSGDTLSLYHQETERNCGALFTFDVSILENTITVTEVDTGDQAWCICHFDLSVSLTGLDPGIYEIEVWGHDIGQDPVFYGSFDVEIGGLGLVDQWESECLATREDTSFIDLSVSSDTLDIFWDTPLLNCALEPVWEGWLSMDTFHVTMVDTGLPADCICPFELRTRFASFQPGNYVLDFWDGVYGYPEFTIAAQRNNPTVVAAYQSPCYDPLSIGDEEAPPIPKQALIDVSSYPNPFNPGTEIRYTLTQSSLVSLSIYDLSGRLVANIDPGFQTAGPHSIQVSLRGKNSGTYVYVLDTPTNHSAGKMILLK